MAPDNREQAGILGRLLEISVLQRRLVEENRIEELLSAQIERAGLFSMLDLSGEPVADSALKELARELAGSDRELSAVVQQVMDAVGSRLGQVKTGMSAVKAYGRY
ncbi:MAG: hypothetical protein A2052_04900 [Deltaproteobacteria bacterium GWA2_54_12]|nr:MAG: hypothetical protein A2052_04900 [Deltaproteobacteria bacterium GWA2_54_12]